MAGQVKSSTLGNKGGLEYDIDSDSSYICDDLHRSL